MTKNIFLFSILLCTLHLFTVTCTASSKITNDQKRLIIDEQLLLASGLTIRGYYNQAITEYEDIIKRFPNNDLTQEAWTQLAYNQSISGKKNAALISYNGFLKKYPNSPIYTAVRINIAKLLGTFDTNTKTTKAIKILTDIINSAIISEQLKDTASFYLAEIYININKQELAKNIYKSLGIKPINNKNIYRAYALLKLAEIYTKDNQQVKSIVIYKILIKNKTLKNDILIEALQSLAIIYTNRKMFEKAANCYKKLSTISPKTKEGEKALYYRLECLYQAKRYNVVIQELDKLLKSSSPQSNDKLLFLKASTLQQQALYSQAQEYFFKILNKNNKSIFYKQSAIQSIISLFKANKRSEAYSTAIKFSNDDLLTQETKEIILNIVAKNSQKNSHMITFLNMATNSITDKKLRIWTEYRLAICYEKANSPSKALICYNNILNSGDSKYSPYALNGIISCELTLNNYEEADKYIEQVFSDYPNNEVFPSAVLTKIEIHIRKSEYDKAFITLNKYKSDLLKSSLWPKAVYYLGCLNFAKKEWNKAETNFKEIISNKTLTQREQTESKLYLAFVYIEKNKLTEAELLLTPLIVQPSNKLLKLNKESSSITYNSYPVGQADPMPTSDSKVFNSKKQSALNYCSSDTILKLGYFFIKVKNYGAAKICFKKLTHSPEDDIIQEAFVGLADTSLAESNLSSAIKQFKKAALLSLSSPNRNKILVLLGKTLMADNRNEEAVIIFQKILENPIDSKSTIAARMHMARILSIQPDRNKRANRYAMSVFILSKEPKMCVEAMLLSIKLSIDAGNFKEAKNTWDELSKRFPESLKSKEGVETRRVIDSPANKQQE